MWVVAPLNTASPQIQHAFWFYTYVRESMRTPYDEEIYILQTPVGMQEV